MSTTFDEPDEVPMLSTGEPSTLGVYLKLVTAFFGADSPGADFIREKIAEDPDGEDGVVVADERQMIYLFVTMEQNK